MPNLLLNPAWRAGAPFGPELRALLDPAAFPAIRAEIESWPGYAPTPLIPLPGLAKALGLAEVWCKHEGARFGVGSFKPLGPTYAMTLVLRGELSRRLGRAVTLAELLAGEHREAASDITFTAATSGNHGRAIAWGAQRFGCKAVIYMGAWVGAGRQQAIADYGAEVVLVEGSYSDVERRCVADAKAQGRIAVSTVPPPDYPHLQRDVMRGYALCADELTRQLGTAPTHLLVPAGSGKITAATCGHLWAHWGCGQPRVVSVEPDASCCVHESLSAGELRQASGMGPAVLDGLVVEDIAPAAWPVLRQGLFASLTVEDSAAIASMKQAAAGEGGDPPLPIGDTGIAAWAGLATACARPDWREALGLGAESRVVLIATEDATDPKVYESLVGHAPLEVADALAGLASV